MPKFGMLNCEEKNGPVPVTFVTGVHTPGGDFCSPKNRSLFQQGPVFYKSLFHRRLYGAALHISVDSATSQTVHIQGLARLLALNPHTPPLRLLPMQSTRTPEPASNL